jgi:hypothetical protein
MPNITFASNNKAHWPLSNTDATADSFDSTKVPYAISLNQDESISSPEFAEVVGDVTWLHCRIWANDSLTAGVVHLMRVFDANQNMMCEVKKVNGIKWLVELIADDGTTTEANNASFNVNLNVVNQIDVRVEVTGALINTSLYINGGLAAVSNIAANVGAFGKPNHFNLGAAFSQISSKVNYSEILVSDSDTRNARMSLLRPTAEGGHTDWVGVAAELADNDPTSGMTSIAIDEYETLALSAYAGASNISSVIIATLSMAGANAPQNLKHIIRLSAVDYEIGSDIPLSPILQYDITDYQENPAASLPWISSHLTSMEAGMRSKT